MKMFVVSLFVLLLSKDIEGKHAWNYADTTAWWHSYQQCEGKRQSPIDIVTVNISNRLTAPFLSYKFYRNLNSIEAENNGHSVNFKLPSGLKVIGDGLPGTFNADGLHLHWGTTSDTGSEHTVNGHHFAMEMHVVLYNNKYANVEEALGFPDGLAVLASLIKEGTDIDNSYYKSLIDNLFTIPYEGYKTYVSGITVANLMSANLGSYYRYFGSLTTPPCSEVVTWTVFTDPILLSANQLEKLRSYIKLDTSMLNNFRPTQPLNGREVQLIVDAP